MPVGLHHHRGYRHLTVTLCGFAFFRGFVL